MFPGLLVVTQFEERGCVPRSGISRSKVKRKQAWNVERMALLRLVFDTAALLQIWTLPGFWVP